MNQYARESRCRLGFPCRARQSKQHEPAACRLYDFVPDVRACICACHAVAAAVPKLTHDATCYRRTLLVPVSADPHMGVIELAGRNSLLATTLHCLQVSFSGQAVVFVVRTARHSLTVLAGRLTYIAYFAAQVRQHEDTTDGSQTACSVDTTLHAAHQECAGCQDAIPFPVVGPCFGRHEIAAHADGVVFCSTTRRPLRC